MKRLIFSLVCLLLLEQASAYDFVFNKIQYHVTDFEKRTVSVVSVSKELKGTIEIPEEIALNYSVTRIGIGAFSGCTEMTSVTIPNSVTSIDSLAFSFCSSLKSVTIPNSVKSIGLGAFYKCSSLASVNIPNSVISIATAAFRECGSLTSIIIPNSITRIEPLTFCGCGSLVSVEIPNSVTSIGTQAFYDCGSLKSIHIPQYVNEIEKEAFSNNTTTYCVALSKPNGWNNKWKSGNDNKVIWGVTPHFSAYAKKMVEPVLNEWQKKGEFEKVADWEKRVTAETREAKIKELTQKAEEEYLVRYQDRNPLFSLGAYDTENEVFLVTNPKYGKILVAVPIERAPYFKEQWNTIRQGIRQYTKYFVENDTISIAEAIFTLPNGEQYKYSNQVALNYNVAQVNYNFAPIDFKSQTTSSGASTKSTQTMTKKSDVDINIPVSNTKQNNAFAVIIANENYQKESRVPFASNDGRIFAEYCKKTLGIPNNNVHIVSDATLNNMKYEVRWLKNVIEAYNGNARVIFYYAGHGIPDEAQKTAYLLPIDGFGNDVSTGYKLDDLYSTLGNLPSKSVTVFLDACFSGANRDGQMLTSARGVAIKAKSSAPVGNMVVFSAAQGDETAYPNNDQQHGMFTYYLLKKIKETSGNVTYKDLSNYVIDNVRKQSIVVNGKSQTPVVVPSATVGGNWESWKLK